jgi:hypothetical protein
LLISGLLVGVVCGCDGLGDDRNPEPLFGVQPTASGKLVGAGSSSSPATTVSTNSVPPIPVPQNPAGTVQLTLNNQPMMDNNPDIRNLQINGSGVAGTPVSKTGGVTIHPPIAAAGVAAPPSGVSPLPSSNPGTPAASASAPPTAPVAFVPAAPSGPVSPGPANPAPAFSPASTADSIKARLQALGMSAYSVKGDAQNGFTFTAYFTDKQADKISAVEATGPTEVAAMQGALEKAQSR